MSYIDTLTRASVDDHRAYMRAYMRKWRADNAAKIKEYEAERRVRRANPLIDGDRDRTVFQPETPEQAAMWSRLLGNANARKPAE